MATRLPGTRAVSIGTGIDCNPAPLLSRQGLPSSRPRLTRSGGCQSTGLYTRWFARGSRQALEVRIDHHPDQTLKVHFRTPTQRRTRFGRITDQVIDLGGTQELRIQAHVPFPVETSAIERHLDQFPNGMALARGDDVVVRLALLKHQPHGADVVA